MMSKLRSRACLFGFGRLALVAWLAVVALPGLPACGVEPGDETAAAPREASADPAAAAIPEGDVGAPEASLASTQVEVNAALPPFILFCAGEWANAASSCHSYPLCLIREALHGNIGPQAAVKCFGSTVSSLPACLNAARALGKCVEGTLRNKTVVATTCKAVDGGLKCQTK